MLPVWDSEAQKPGEVFTSGEGAGGRTDQAVAVGLRLMAVINWSLLNLLCIGDHADLPSRTSPVTAEAGSA